MNQGCQVQDQLNTSEPIIIGRQLNLRKLSDRQMGIELTTIRTAATDDDSASAETATTAYIIISLLVK